MADISYNKTTWVNGSTALNAANLNNIETGMDNATKAINNKVDKVDGKGLSTHDFNDHYKSVIDNLQGEGGISVIELTNKNGTIASAQLGEINANPQNFAFKYSGKILSFTKADSTTYQYCNNIASSSENNVTTTSTLLTITSSTGVYTIAENVHKVVANSTDPVNGGDLTNIQVGSKVYSIPSGSATKMINLGTLTESGTIDAGKLQELMTLLQNEDLFQVIFRYGDAFFVTASARNDLTSSDKDIYAVCVDADSVAVVNLSISVINGNYTITTNKNYNVEANPTGTGTTDLTNLKVGSTVYNIPSGANIKIDTELSETSENPVQNKAVTTAITSLRERKYDQNNFQLRDGDYTSYQKDLSRIYRTEFNENGEKTNVSYRIPVIKAGGSMGAGWKPFEGIKLDGQDYVFWLNNYKFGTNEEYKHTSSNFDYAEIQDLMYNGFRYRTQTIIDLDKLGFSDSRGTLTDEIITMIKNGSNIVIIHGGVTYRDYTEDANYYNFTCIDYKNNANDYWILRTLRIGKNDNSLLLFYGDRHYFVDANSSTVAYNYLTRLKIGNTNYMISYVKANPSETGTENLTSLKVGSTVYNIPSGSSSGGSSGWVNILELNDTDATAVGNAISKLYKSDNDTTEIPLTTPVDFSKAYQYISYTWDGAEVVQTIGRCMNLLGSKLYMSMDKLSYFSTFEADNKSLGLTLAVTEENGVSKGTIYVARTATM